jgi:PAS domain S-box-containing protein
LPGEILVSLRSKIIVVVFVIVAAFISLHFLVRQVVILESFAELERHEAEKDMERCQEALKQEIISLSTLCKDWAAWDDTYEFVQEPSQEFRSSNLIKDTFFDARLNFIGIYRKDGQKVWAQARILPGLRVLQVKEFSLPKLPMPHPFLAHNNLRSEVGGVLLTEHGPMIVVSRPITTSDNRGPIRGAIIMGRFLTDDYVKKIAKLTRVNLKIWPLNLKNLPSSELKANNQLAQSASSRVIETSPESLMVYSTFAGIKGQPALLLRADVPREISQHGKKAVGFAMLSLGGVGILILAVLVLLLQRIVIGPVVKLTRHARDIRKSNDLSARLNMKRSDELGQLALEFDSMIARMAEDRAERRRVEAALRESEEKFRSISSNAQDGIVMIDHQGKITLWNQAAEKMFGYQSKDILGEEFKLIFITEENDEEFSKIIPRFGQEDGDYSSGETFELKAKKQKGEEFPVEVSLSSLRLQDQWYTVGLIRDISDRKKAENDLKESEEQLRLITDNLPVLIAHLDTELKYLFNNKYYEYWYGFSRPEIKGRKLKDVIGEDNYQKLKGPLSEALSGKAVAIEESMVVKNGQVRQVSATIIPHRDQRGVLKGLFTLIMDITDRKRAEDERIFREKLQTAIETAGAVCHELNQPLQTMLSKAELILMRHPQEEPLHGYLDTFLRESQRMAGITRRLQRITNYKTKPYVGEEKILDLEKSSS